MSNPEPTKEKSSSTPSETKEHITEREALK